MGKRNGAQCAAVPQAARDESASSATAESSSLLRHMSSSEGYREKNTVDNKGNSLIVPNS
jgi:hypothetical protein